MQNLAMAKKLTDGEAIDLKDCKKTKPGEYELTEEQAATIAPQYFHKPGCPFHGLSPWGEAWEKLAESLDEDSCTCGQFRKEGVDLCDSETELWMWSVGIHKESRRVVASSTTRLYQHPDFFCIWLR